MRFLFVMFEGGGNVPPQLAIARRLVGRGHTVQVLGDPAIEADARAAGCELVAFRFAPHHNLRDRGKDLVQDWLARTSIAQVARFTREVMFGPAEAYARDALAAIERFAPDALAIDCMVFGALAAAEKTALPAATLIHTICPFPVEGAPPFGFGLRPARGWPGRLRDRLLGRIAVATFDRRGLAPLNAARAAVGLAPIDSVIDQLWRTQRSLVLTARSFDFAARGRLPDSVVYVGPELDDPAWAEPWTAPWPPSAQLPLVVVALGSTFQNQHQLNQRVIDALGSLPVRGLVTLGGVFAPGDFRLPANVVAVASAPHRAAFPMARIVVAHGGHGTTIKALAHGVPVLVVPLGRDQADNAARVVEAGAGLRISPGARVPALRRALVRLLDDPAFTDAARRIATEISQDVSADRAIHELEGLASGSARNST